MYVLHSCVRVCPGVCGFGCGPVGFGICRRACGSNAGACARGAADRNRVSPRPLPDRSRPCRLLLALHAGTWLAHPHAVCLCPTGYSTTGDNRASTGTSRRCYTCRVPSGNGLTAAIRTLPSERFGELPQIVLRRPGGFLFGSQWWPMLVMTPMFDSGEPCWHYHFETPVMCSMGKTKPTWRLSDPSSLLQVMQSVDATRVVRRQQGVCTF